LECKLFHKNGKRCRFLDGEEDNKIMYEYFLRE